MNPIRAFVQLVDINKKPKMTVCEVGAYDGTTTKEYVDIIKQNNGHLYIIDWFNGNQTVECGPHSYNTIRADTVYGEFIKNVNPYLDIITIKRGKSHDMINELDDHSLDICFIDADHRYSIVYKDIELCLKKVKIGGLICGHDCEGLNNNNDYNMEWVEHDTFNGKHYGVIKAVHDHFGHDVEIISDIGGQNVPLWAKRIW